MGSSSDTLREPLGVVQGALIGFMGLVLAFGLSLALGRYESRPGRPARGAQQTRELLTGRWHHPVHRPWSGNQTGRTPEDLLCVPAAVGIGHAGLPSLRR